MLRYHSFFMQRLVAGVLILFCTVSVFAHDFRAQGIYYNILEDGVTAEVTYKGESNNSSAYKGDVVIPEVVRSQGYTYRVIGIDETAFGNCEELTSVTIPNSIEWIGKRAFKGCRSLTSITIPESVSEVSAGLFTNCSFLETVVLSEGVETISGFAFAGCTSLRSITIPRSVKKVASSLFVDCHALQYNEFDTGKYLGNAENPYYLLVSETQNNIVSCTGHPDTRLIADGAFGRCNHLASLVIPAKVATVGAGAFAECPRLQLITFEGTTPPRIGNQCFSNVGADAVVTIPAGSLKAYEAVWHQNGVWGKAWRDLWAKLKKINHIHEGN